LKNSIERVAKIENTATMTAAALVTQAVVLAHETGFFDTDPRPPGDRDERAAR
jgi:hypothetical protein